MRGLTERVVLIAGAATGIGAASAIRLAQEGAKLVVADTNFAGAEETAKLIRSTGGDALALQYDQGDESSIAQMVSSAANYFGALHGLHANAAEVRESILGRDRDIATMDVAVWQRTLLVNTIGYGVLVREVLPHLVAAGGGAIVLTSSVAAHLNDKEGGRPAYASSKAGINALCRHVASLWGSKGIRCNAVAPGVVLTKTLLGTLPPSEIEKFLAATRSTRLGTPEDIAGVASFLLSQDASWVNGQVWTVDGGLTFRG
jgi:NAD(P)-dependent dehydrogenase (short-subunit alcohol dehydrogenase family)